MTKAEPTAKIFEKGVALLRDICQFLGVGDITTAETHTKNTMNDLASIRSINEEFCRKQKAQKALKATRAARAATVAASLPKRGSGN